MITKLSVSAITNYYILPLIVCHASMFVSIVKQLVRLLMSVRVCLAGAQDPPLSVVRKFAHLLEQSNLDLQEEQEVKSLREEVVTKIRANQQMEKDLNLMDIKIGLLVKNRITLQV